MIILRKLEPAELAERIKVKEIEQEIKLVRDEPFYLPYFNSVLLLDDYVGTRIPDDIVSDFDCSMPMEIMDSVLENHLQYCEFCESSEPCSSLESILAA